MDRGDGLDISPQIWRHERFPGPREGTAPLHRARYPGHDCLERPGTRQDGQYVPHLGVRREIAPRCRREHHRRAFRCRHALCAQNRPGAQPARLGRGSAQARWRRLDSQGALQFRLGLGADAGHLRHLAGYRIDRLRHRPACGCPYRPGSLTARARRADYPCRGRGKRRQGFDDIPCISRWSCGSPRKSGSSRE